MMPFHYSSAEVQANSETWLVGPHIATAHVRLEDRVHPVLRNAATVVLDRELPSFVGPLRGDVDGDRNTDPTVLARVLQQILEEEPEQDLVGDDSGEIVPGDRRVPDELVHGGEHPVRLVERLAGRYPLLRIRAIDGKPGRD